MRSIADILEQDSRNRFERAQKNRIEDDWYYSAPLGAASSPTLNLSNASFPENSTLNTVIGTLSVTNGTGSYTYSFQSNPGTLFNISGTSLRVTSTSIAAGSYSVTIRADNGAGSVIDRVFLLTATVAANAGKPMGLLLTLTYAS